MYRWIFFLGIACAAQPLAGGQDGGPFPRGYVFFSTSFQGAEPLAGWSGKAAIEPGYQGGSALCVQRRDGPAEGSQTVEIALPVEKMRGYLVNFSAVIKARDVSRKPQPWNGVKFMAPIVTPGGKSWPAAELEAGSFDWRPAAFAARVPANATSIKLVLGLELVTGKAWFDNIRVSVSKPPIIPRPRTVAGPADTGQDVPRLRGAMVSPNIDDEGLRVFGKVWNANLIRWQLIRPTPVADPLDLSAYDRWLKSALAKLDAALPRCREYGLRVVVDLHSPPGGQATGGGYAGSDHGLFTDAVCQRKFVDLWQRMARKYRGVEGIWGFDLANEPVEGVVADGLADWQELAERAARAIRAVDPKRTIIVEPAEGGGPRGLAELQPLDLPNVVYSVHMYEPTAFTHQGVFSKQRPVRYPGEIEGVQWGKAQLQAVLQPAIDFQKAYGVPMYIGEFSAIRWAPDESACRYLKDVIEIFEAHGWDWSYHAFREWDGWSVEHGPDPRDHARSKTQTERERLLRAWFAKNIKENP